MVHIHSGSLHSHWGRCTDDWILLPVPPRLPVPIPHVAIVFLLATAAYGEIPGQRRREIQDDPWPIAGIYQRLKWGIPAIHWEFHWEFWEMCRRTGHASAQGTGQDRTEQMDSPMKPVTISSDSCQFRHEGMRLSRGNRGDPKQCL